MLLGGKVGGRIEEPLCMIADGAEESVHRDVQVFVGGTEFGQLAVGVGQLAPEGGSLALVGNGVQVRHGNFSLGRVSLS